MQHGISIEKLYQDKVWIIRGFSVEPVSVDAWEQAVRDYVAHMNATDRYLVYDLTPIERPGLTVYMNKRITALAHDNRNATGRVAVALNLNPTIRYIFEPFIRLTSIQIQPRLSVRLFDDATKGLNWVLETVPSELKQSSS